MDHYNHAQICLKIHPFRITREGHRLIIMSWDTNLVATDCIDDGVVPWVREVLQEVLKWSFPSHVVLNYESQECQHSQSPYTKHTQTRLAKEFSKSNKLW